MLRTAIVLPVCGPPAMATCPPALSRSRWKGGLALLEGVVDKSERPVRLRQPRQRDALRQRRQPHLVRVHAAGIGDLAGLGHHRIQQRGGAVLLNVSGGRQFDLVAGEQPHVLLAGVLHHRARQRARDVRRAEAGQLHACLEVAGPGLAGQLVGIRHAEDLAGLAGGERLQADAVGQVRIQPAQLALLQPLRGEQQMHAQRTAEPAHRHEQVRKVWVLGEQLGELVDHDDQ